MAQSLWHFTYTAVLCVWITFALSCSPSNEKEKNVPPKETVPVVVTEIRARDFPLIIESVGRLAANREVTLAAEVGGVVEECRVDMGDKVTTDQVLVCINPVDYQLGLNEAKANFRAMQARLDTATKTFKRNPVNTPGLFD